MLHRLSLRCPATALAVLLIAGAASARDDVGKARALQGPMLGPVTPTGVCVWVRISGEFPVVVEYAAGDVLKDSAKTEPIVARADEDLIVVQRLSGLQPDTTYTYRVLYDGKPDPYSQEAPAHFHTAPAGPAKFRLAFGSCARFQVNHQQDIWRTVTREAPDLLAWLGDNMYGDSLVPYVLAEEYRNERGVASLQPVLRNVPQLAIWDDHDYGLNDHDASHPGKVQALSVFRQYWPNPAYGTAELPGVFFQYQYGGVDFFFLDGRYYRSPNAAPDGPGKTFLGAGQMAWLQDGLKASKAPFKVLVCGSGWSAAKGEAGDSWSAFRQERDRFFQWIQDEAISGVVLLSGDTHVGELNCIPRSGVGAYDLYDLVSSPLAQPAEDNWTSRHPEQRLRPGFVQPNVGMIDFDLTASPATLRFNLYGEDGSAAWEPLTLRADQLVNGVVSWKENDRFED